MPTFVDLINSEFKTVTVQDVNNTVFSLHLFHKIADFTKVLLALN